MTLGTILVPAYDLKGLKHAVAAARPYAESAKAKLVGLHVRERYPVGAVAEYYWHAPIVEEFQSGIAQRAEEMRAAFEEGAAGLETEWRQPEGTEVVDLGIQARLADLVVVPAPAVCERTDAAGMAEAVLVGSGRCVLVAPPGEARPVPRHILLAWNGSVEAARAAAIARPMLNLAERVTVLSVGDIAIGMPEPGAVADALRRSGLAAEGRSVAKGQGGVTATLAEQAEMAEADAVLLGAYSHTRLRERILGGVTRRLVTEPKLPTFMVH
ncbi:universal stress protein [Parvularcula oceani]|uniref:universal stress protein n=1 Tax=Parvularcula oceani TaxID=1247963 RepID=UPI000AD594F5|nr:universal stress protein [Parvularcula oceani]